MNLEERRKRFLEQVANTKYQYLGDMYDDDMKAAVEAEREQRWVLVYERLPPVGQLVCLRNTEIWKSYDPLLCRHDVGVLEDWGGYHWATYGQSRAVTLDAYTHWLEIPFL